MISDPESPCGWSPVAIDLCPKFKLRGDVMPLLPSCTEHLSEPVYNRLDGIPPEPGGRQPSRDVVTLWRLAGRRQAGGLAPC